MKDSDIHDNGHLPFGPEPEAPNKGPLEKDDRGNTVFEACRGGSNGNGVCLPFWNEYRGTWMSYYKGCRNLRIADSILPGTHNSGYDKKAPHTNSLETCQDHPPFEQLMTGIRVLDLRVRFNWGYPDKDPRRFSIIHDSASGRTVEVDFLETVLTFHRHKPAQGSATKEVVILDFHDLQEFTHEAHLELRDIIKKRIGSSLIPPWMSDLTLQQIWNYDGLNVVVAYRNDDRDPLFWPGVNQRWIGHNTPSTDELKDFLNGVAHETKPYDELRAAQCAKYNKFPLYTPDDFSDKVMDWFYPYHDQAYIQDFFIINTDWSLRQRLVDCCIVANDDKAERIKGYYSYTIPQSTEHTLTSGYRVLIAYMANAHWTKTLHLPLSAPAEGSLQIVTKAQYSTELIMARSDFPAASITLRMGDILNFAPHPDPEITWQLLGPRYLAENNQPNIPVPLSRDKFSRYILEDGHWNKNLQLPLQAPAWSIIGITSSAGYTSTLSGNNLQHKTDVSIPTGFRGAFMFHADTGLWEQLGKPARIPGPRNRRWSWSGLLTAVKRWLFKPRNHREEC